MRCGVGGAEPFRRLVRVPSVLENAPGAPIGFEPRATADRVVEVTAADRHPTPVAASAIPAPPVSTSAARFEHFYETSAPSVHRALTLTVGSADLAADATAEAMARAFARWPTVSRYDNPAGWVYRVGLNWATSRFRKRRREVLMGEGLTADAADGRSRSTSAHVPAASDPSLTEALAALPVEQRAVVVLRYLLDWSEAETASALGIATGTAKSRQHRGLARLAELLEETDAPRI